MEALAAVGLAGNIVQFVDFSCSLFNQANSIYRSQSGTTHGAQDLESITESLQDLCARLEKGLDNQYHRGNHGSQQNLKALAKGCHNTAKELVSVLLSVRAKKADSRWHSFRASLAGLMKEAEITHLEKRLMNYRSQIIIELQDLQGQDYNKIVSRLISIEKQGQQSSVLLSDQISALRAETKDSLTALIHRMSHQDAHQTNVTYHCDRVHINTLAGKLTHAGDSWVVLVAASKILNQLRFEGMSERYTSVREAHTGTFEWAFANQLSDWLRSDDALFWVTGKPGSGKSTLMKRLVDDPRTTSLLRKWSGVEVPVVASYFFWIKGTRLQRSDMGLLRCVLHDYLRQCPLAMSHVFPNLWANHAAQVQLDNPTDWKREDLLQAFHRLPELDTKSAHLCLFIDGLDEYQGDHQDLIETVQYLSRLKIKICVASRPWNIFSETFGRLPRLRMQDLNKPDIAVYVRDHLFLRHDFQRACVATTDMSLIMSEITEKSQGVFLWVYLVVRSLIEGLRNRDSISLLTKRLSSYPSDLNEFFYDMFSSLDPIYHNKTAKMFLLTLETMSSPYTEAIGPIRLTTLTHWYLDELEEHPGLPILPHPTNLDEDTIVQYSDAASLRINGRCKGLLEVIPGPVRRQTRAETVQQGDPGSHYWYEVEFLHRTVADFFETPDIQHMLNEWLVEDLSSLFLVCRAMLAEINAIIAVTENALVDELEPTVTRFLRTVALQEKSRGTTLTPLLDDFSKLLFRHRLCDLLKFARMMAEYDLLIYLETSPSTQIWIQQPASKTLVVEHTRHSSLTCQLTAGEGSLTRSLTANMIRLIHSMGPMVEIGHHAQDNLTRFAGHGRMSDGEYIAMIRELTKTAFFELAPMVQPGSTSKRWFASTDFTLKLVELIGTAQTHQLAESCLQLARKGHNVGQDKVEKKSHKQEMRKTFHKLFGRMRS